MCRVAGGNSFSAICHLLCAYYVRIKTAHKLGYIYIFWRDNVWSSLVIWTVFGSELMHRCALCVGNTVSFKGPCKCEYESM
jgi:hypothetical protein